MENKKSGFEGRMNDFGFVEVTPSSNAPNIPLPVIDKKKEQQTVVKRK
jgi:hypothetical protein